MKRYRDSLLDFTDRGWNDLYEIVDDPLFREHEAEKIYRNLTQEQRRIPFCDYLKRFLYDSAGLSGPYQEIPLSEYQGILRAAFRETGTPASFEDSSTRLSAALTNWLSQKTVSRQAILLLGFGLSLSVAEVNAFLMRALHGEALRDSDPREMIAKYCYDYGFGFPKFEELWERFEEENWENAEDPEENKLFARLKEAGGADPERSLNAAFISFMELYKRVCEALAAGQGPLREPFRRPEQITPAELETVFYEGVPRDANDNLLPLKNSALYEVFCDRRLTRKRIHSLLRKETAVDRSDLITLNFYLWSREDKEDPQPRKRYSHFVEDTNRILRQAGFDELYAALPYESFLMMCMLTDDPMDTYTEVWERSYKTAQE